ncbi:MAG: hypothetical protein RL011_179, partial [Pseudomonadota bacterium]
MPSIFERGTLEPSTRRSELNSYILSYGTYLPAKRVSTRALVKKIQSKNIIPLAKENGIKFRRVAPDSSSLELARMAVDKCLERSEVEASEIDVVIACNIAKLTSGGRSAEFEPSEAAMLAGYLGLKDALCFDVNNACAGMMTGIYLANHLLKEGQCRLALVVSGEYISHMAFTAVNEIKSAADSKLACLTLGDGGAAVLLAATTDNDFGFRYVDLKSFPKYSNLCYAMPSTESHGGLVMKTDSMQMLINGSRLTRKAFMDATRLKKINWSKNSWVIPHQISDSAIECCDSAVRSAIKSDAIRANAVLSNIESIGNTASTTHILALARSIATGKVKDHEHIVFAVQASGLIIGLLEYQLDDLPSRIKVGKRTARTKVKKATIPSVTQSGLRTITRPVCIQGVAVDFSEANSIKMASAAARKCLESARVNFNDLPVLIHTGTITSDWIEEPAASAMIAGDLAEQVGEMPANFFSLDIRNGALGFLNALFLACSRVDRIKCKNILITHSMDASHASLDGSTSGGGAMLLSASTAEDRGFSNFYFRCYGEHAGKRKVSLSMTDGRPRLSKYEDQDYEASAVECICDALKDYLEQGSAVIGDFKWIL